MLFRPPNSGALDTIDQIFEDADRLIARGRNARPHNRGGSGAGGATKRYVAKSHNFQNLGQAAKLKVIRKSNLRKRRNRRFCYKMSRKNSLKSIRYSAKGFASAVRSYFAFCETQGAKPYPLKEETIKAWRSIPNDNPTLGNCLNFIKKACFLNGDNAECLDPDVVNIDRCLQLLGNENVRFPNFIKSPIVIKISKHAGIRSELPPIGFYSLPVRPQIPF